MEAAKGVCLVGVGFGRERGWSEKTPCWLWWLGKRGSGGEGRGGSGGPAVGDRGRAAGELCGDEPRVRVRWLAGSSRCAQFRRVSTCVFREKSAVDVHRLELFRCRCHVLSFVYSIP